MFPYEPRLCRTSLDVPSRVQSIPRVSEKSAERFVEEKYMTRVGFMSDPACMVKKVFFEFFFFSVLSVVTQNSSLLHKKDTSIVDSRSQNVRSLNTFCRISRQVIGGSCPILLYTGRTGHKPDSRQVFFPRKPLGRFF